MIIVKKGAYPNIHSATSSPASTKTASSDDPPLGIMDMDLIDTCPGALLGREPRLF